MHDAAQNAPLADAPGRRPITHACVARLLRPVGIHLPEPHWGRFAQVVANRSPLAGRRPVSLRRQADDDRGRGGMAVPVRGDEVDEVRHGRLGFVVIPPGAARSGRKGITTATFLWTTEAPTRQRLGPAFAICMPYAPTARIRVRLLWGDQARPRRCDPFDGFGVLCRAWPGGVRVFRERGFWSARCWLCTVTASAVHRAGLPGP